MSRLFALGGLIVAGVLLATQLPADDPSLPSLPSHAIQPTPDNGPGLGASGSDSQPRFVEPRPTMRGDDNLYHNDLPGNAPGYGSSPSYDNGPSYNDASPSYDAPYSHSGPVDNEMIHNTPAYSEPMMSRDSYDSYDHGIHYESAQPGYGPQPSSCGCQNGGNMNSSISQFAAGSVYYGDSGSYGMDSSPYAVGGGTPYTGAFGGGSHVRHPFYSYRAPWYYRGPASQNVNIVW
ncbi:MAG: hypothetical protein R3C01_03595 [Planctomycetaceae bacterium]